MNINYYIACYIGTSSHNLEVGRSISSPTEMTTTEPTTTVSACETCGWPLPEVNPCHWWDNSKTKSRPSSWNKMAKFGRCRSWVCFLGQKSAQANSFPLALPNPHYINLSSFRQLRHVLRNENESFAQEMLVECSSQQVPVSPWAWTGRMQGIKPPTATEQDVGNSKIVSFDH